MMLISNELKLSISSFIEEYCPKGHVFFSKEKTQSYVVIIKHCKSGKFIPRTGKEPYDLRFLYYLLRKGRMEIAGFLSCYLEDPDFVLYTVPVKDYEEAFNVCCWVCEKYQNSDKLLTPRGNDFFFKVLPNSLLEIIDGAVAGDGGIYKRGSSAIFQLTLGEKQLGHLEEFKEELSKYGYSGKIRTGSTMSKGKTFKTCSLTWTLKCFLEHRERWYNQDGKKLPNDLKNSPSFWRWFYAGDGCLYVLSPFSYRVVIATNDFSTEDVDKLLHMLSDLGIKAVKYIKRLTPESQKPQWVITLNNSSDVDKFLDYVGPPVKSLEYKWLRPVREKRICKGCRINYTPSRGDNEYCSVKCLDTHRQKIYYQRKKAKR